MYFRTLIIAVFVLTVSAFPLYPSAEQRDASLADPRENEAQDKTQHSKDVHTVYKSYVDSSDLYAAEEEAGRRGNPMEEEMRRKISAESERLRDRLRQGLAELTERLSPDPLGAPLGDLRRRLAPLIQHLRGSLSDNVREVCGQLSLYLRGLEWAESRAESRAESTSAYREALHGIGRTLEQGGARLTDITGDFQSKVWEEMDQKRERGGGGGGGAWPEEEEEAEEEARLWGEMRSMLGQEVSSVRLEAQSRRAALEAELAAVLGSSQPLNTEAAAVGVNGFCQSAELQNQVSLARIERLLLGSEEEQEAPGGPAAPALPSQAGSLLQEDFSAKFSALIQDILHSVQ